MNPTPNRQLGGHDHTPLAPAPHPAVPITDATRRPIHRRRLRSARARLLATHHARPTTVWPCAEDDRREGAGVLSGWLHTAVVKIVTTYTRPGDRVLLLTPPDRVRGARWPGSTAAPSPGRYAGLHEAAWTIVRLGRSVQTHTAAEPDSTNPADPPTVPARVGIDEHLGDESGPGLGRTTDPHPWIAWASTESACPGDTDRRTVGTGRYALIITAAYPQATDWLHTTAWTDQLLPNGTLAVVTHGDLTSGRWVDPTPAVVGAARRAGLAYLDHIALLEVPLRHGHPVAPQPTKPDADASDAARSGSTPTATPIPIRVHSDLHVFGPVPGAGSGKTSDTTRTITPNETVTHTRKSSDV